MDAKKGAGTRPQDLRARAEAGVRKPRSGVTPLTAEEAEKLIEELRAHQTELELQNQELRQAELRLACERDRYANLYNSAPVGHITLDWQSVTKEVNQIAADMLGRERAGLLGTSLSRYLNVQGGHTLHVHLLRTRKADVPQVCELELERADGTLRPVQVQSVAVHRSGDADTVCQTILSDLTERRQFEETLASRTRQLETLMDNAPDMIARLDRQGRYLLINQRYAKLAGISPDQAAGKSCYEQGGFAEVGDAWRSALARVFDTGQMQELDLEVAGADRPQFYQARIVPEFAADGRVETALALVREVTEQRRLQADLNQAQKMEVVGRLATGIAHDINNVLTAIAGYTTLARMRLPADHEIARDLEHVEEAVQDAGGIANGLLAFAHKLPAVKRPVELRAMIHAAARLLRRMLPAAIELVTDVSEEPGVWVLGDRTQLQQVILNLAVNARDAMPNGGTVRVALVTGDRPTDAAGAVSEVARPACACVEIGDTGSGIAPDAVPHIFEPFFTTKPVGLGTGLGLAIVKSVVEQHGGQIEVQSRAGQGTTFTVRLPRIAPPASDAALEAPPTVRGHGELVLVAEDNRHVLQILATGLRQVGYEPVEAMDACELLAQCARWQERLRLLVVDIDLPKGSGLEALQSIRRQSPATPAIVITGKIDFDLEALADARTRTLRKPFRLSDFLRVVAELLAARREMELAS